MKEWWQDFFIPVAGEVLFKPKSGISKAEVDQVLKKCLIPKKSQILDLACGVGRHSIEFAKPGHEVVGLDFSKSFLSEAKRSSLKSKTKIRFVKGDMKNLRVHFSPESFDLVVSLFNSFGYFKNKQDDQKMLHEVYRVLKPGGKFVINTLNGLGVQKHLAKPISIGREPVENVFMIDAAKFDPKKSQTQSEWTIIDARTTKTKIHRLKFHQNVYTHVQLKRMLRIAGFKIETTWGMLPDGEFDPSKTWHQTILARK